MVAQSNSAAPWRVFLRRHSGKLVASGVITVLIVYTVHQGGLKFLPEGGDFKQVRWWTVPLYVLSLIAYTWFRSVRWRFLLRPIAEIPRRRLFAVSCVGFAAIVILPFRIGEIVRPYLIRTPPEERVAGHSRTITLTAATSSVVAERVIDGLYLSLVLALALFFVPTVHPLPDRVVGLPVSVEHVRMSGYAMLVLFTGAFSTIATFYFAKSWAQRTTLTLLGRLSRPLAAKLSATFEKLADGLHFFRNLPDALGFLAETTVYWGINALGVWLLAWGCGVVHADGSPATLGEACAIMGMLGCAVLIPGPPGLLGVFQAGIYAAMTMFYPTAIVTGSGAAFVFLMYASHSLLTVALGALGLAMERRGLRMLEEAEGLVPVAADVR